MTARRGARTAGDRAARSARTGWTLPVVGVVVLLGLSAFAAAADASVVRDASAAGGDGGAATALTGAAETALTGAAAAPSPYAQSVLADSPTLYLRLDDAGPPLATDASGHGLNGTYQNGVTLGATGALATDPTDAAISASGLAVTQSGSALPAGNSARTVEFWLQGGRQNPIAFTYGGGGGTNDQFRVEVFAGQLWLSVDSSHSLGSAQYALNLPEAWWDGNWHLFDVTYDGGQALGYMDGQLVGNFGLRTPLATGLGSPLRLGDRYDLGYGTNGYSLDEFAVYPSALPAARIAAHWTLGASAAGTCSPAAPSPYGQSILSDSPSLFMRLDGLPDGTATRVAYDSSSACAGQAPTNGAYLDGVSSVQGVTNGDDDTAITSSGLAVTQSATGLPSGNAPRTMEFWIRGSRQNPIAFTYGGGNGTNDQFRVELFGSQLWLTTSSSLGYGGGEYQLDLPEAWWDGNWHLFDVTYDGTDALGYMDGQLVGSFGVLSPLATALQSPLRLGDRYDLGYGTNAYSLDEFAIYPSALSQARVSAHWQAQTAAPAGMAVVGGSAVIGGGGGATGARIQACPTSGAACVVDPYAVDQFGVFHFLVPDGSYTVTIFPPSGSASPADTIGPVTLPPSALNLSATFTPPGGLPTGLSFSSPSTGTQQNASSPACSGASRAR